MEVGEAGAALFGLLGALVGAVITAALAERRERRNRRAEYQQQAVTGLQDAALGLRLAAKRYGRAQPEDPLLADALLEATGRLDLRVERVDDDGVRSLLHTWRAVAIPYFAGDPDVTARQEEDAYGALNRRIGETLRQRL